MVGNVSINYTRGRDISAIVSKDVVNQSGAVRTDTCGLIYQWTKTIGIRNIHKILCRLVG